MKGHANELSLGVMLTSQFLCETLHTWVGFISLPKLNPMLPPSSGALWLLRPGRSFSGRRVQKPMWKTLPTASPFCHLPSLSLASPSYWCTHTHNLAARSVVPWAAAQAPPGTLSELYNLRVHPKPVEWESAFSRDPWWFKCTFKVWETLR